jgi:hypothetical protein
VPSGIAVDLEALPGVSAVTADAMS